MMTEAEQIQAYKAVRSRLWGSGKVVNVYAEEQQRIEEWKRNQRREWEIEQETIRRLEEAKRRFVFDASTLTVNGNVMARFADEPQMPAGSFQLSFLRRSMQEIAKEVLRSYPEVTLGDIKGPIRKGKIMLARRHVIAAIRMYRPDISFPAIGRFVHKDHSSCIHAVKRFTEERMACA